MNSIVVWLLSLKEFEDNGIACIREIYDECVGKQESELNKAPVVTMVQKVPDIKMIDDSVGEKICKTDVTSKNILDSNWTKNICRNIFGNQSY